MGETPTPDTTPTEFLTQLGSDLSAKEGIDSGLASILKAHILTVAPAADCVTKARAAITALAKKRAAPPQSKEAEHV
jgi:hypothetical protein